MLPPFDNDSFSKTIGVNFARSVKAPTQHGAPCLMQWTAQDVVLLAKQAARFQALFAPVASCRLSNNI
jgi:hypothetical protein